MQEFHISDLSEIHRDDLTRQPWIRNVYRVADGLTAVVVPAKQSAHLIRWALRMGIPVERILPLDGEF